MVLGRLADRLNGSCHDFVPSSAVGVVRQAVEIGWCLAHISRQVEGLLSLSHRSVSGCLTVASAV